MHYRHTQKTFNNIIHEWYTFLTILNEQEEKYVITNKYV